MAFPSTSVLTSFTGSDENPLSEGGAWGGTIRTDIAGRDPLQRLSNQAAITGVAGTNESVWNTSYGEDQECFVTVATAPSAGGLSIWCRVQSEGTSGIDAYNLSYVLSGTTLQVFKIVNAGFTGLGSPVTQTVASGDSIGLVARGSASTSLEIWYKAAAGSWTLLDTVVDASSPVTGAGKLGIGINASPNACRLDDFGGGALPGGRVSLPITFGAVTAGDVVGAAAPEFPHTSVLTSFTGADEEPLSEGGNWAGTIRVDDAARAPCRRLTNRAAPPSDSGDAGESVWDTTFAANQEVFATLGVVPGGTSGFSLYARIQGEGTSGADAYNLSYNVGTGFRFFRMVNSAFTQVGSTIVQAMAAGDKAGLAVIGSELQCWYKSGAGAWTMLGSQTDTTITGTGKIGMTLTVNTAARLDDFGGGSIVAQTGSVSLPITFGATVAGIGSGAAPAAGHRRMLLMGVG